MTQEKRAKPIVLIVRDGWGHNPFPEWNHANAIHLARTPVDDSIRIGFRMEVCVKRVAAAPCGGRKVSEVSRMPTSATGGGRYLVGAGS